MRRAFRRYGLGWLAAAMAAAMAVSWLAEAGAAGSGVRGRQFAEASEMPWCETRLRLAASSFGGRAGVVGSGRRVCACQHLPLALPETPPAAPKPDVLVSFFAAILAAAIHAADISSPSGPAQPSLSVIIIREKLPQVQNAHTLAVSQSFQMVVNSSSTFSHRAMLIENAGSVTRNR